MERNPYDNAFCEGFIKTLKREEIYANDTAASMSWAPIWKSSSTTTTTGSGSTPHGIQNARGVRSRPRIADCLDRADSEFFKA